MKTLLFAAVLGLSIAAQARTPIAPVLTDENDQPVCYTGNPQDAIEFLLDMGFDPQLSNIRVVQARCIGSKPVIVAQQIDENGELYATISVPKCDKKNQPTPRCGRN